MMERSPGLWFLNCELAIAQVNTISNLLLSTDGITSLLGDGLVLLGLDGRAKVVELSSGHISNMFSEGLLRVGLGSVMELVTEILRVMVVSKNPLRVYIESRSLVFLVGS